MGVTPPYGYYNERRWGHYFHLEFTKIMPRKLEMNTNIYFGK